MKKVLATVLSACMLLAMLTTGITGLFTSAASNTAGAERQMKIETHVQFYRDFIEGTADENGNVTLVKVGTEAGKPVYNDADIALPGTLIDTWADTRGYYDFNEYTHRYLKDYEYITYKIEVDAEATEVIIDDVYFSRDKYNANFFGVQLSADGLNWLTAGNYASNTTTLATNWHWYGPDGVPCSVCHTTGGFNCGGQCDDVMDESWNRGNNNRTILSRCEVVDGKKVVYLRIATAQSTDAHDGSVDDPYQNAKGQFTYNNFKVLAKVGDTYVPQMKIKTYTQYYRDHGIQYGITETEGDYTYPVYSEADLALQGVAYDPWAGNRPEDANERHENPAEWSYRKLTKGQYVTFKLEVDAKATGLELNDGWLSGCNWANFGVQISADGLNWKTFGDKDDSPSWGSGFKWSGNEDATMDVDESWGRGDNDKTVLAQCGLNEDGTKKIVYVRLVAGFNNSTRDGSVNKTVDGTENVNEYNTNGVIPYVSFYLDAIVPQVESIAVTTAPKTVYDYNTDLDVTGGKITLTYSDGATEEVDMTADMVSGFDKLAVGTQTLTVTYAGKTATYDVTVNEKAITSIALASAPSKTAYDYGEALDVAGGKLTVTYSDNSTEDVEITAAMVSGYDANTVGEQTLTVTYGDKTVTYTVTVKEALLVETTSIELKVGMGTEYNDSLIVENTEGSYNKDIFGNGDLYRVQETADDYVVYALDLNNFTTDIEYKHTWTYDMANGFTVELSKDGENFEVWGTHNVDGSGGSIAASDYTWNDEAVTNVLTDNPQKLVYIKLKGVMKFNNMGFTITTVTDPSQLKDVASATVTGEYKTQYMAGETLDVSGMILHVVYTDGTEEDIKVWNRMVTGFDSNTLGEQTLTVTSDKAVATTTIKVGEFSGVKTEGFYFEMDGPFGLEIFEGEDLANRQKQFEESAFNWEEDVLSKRPNALKISEYAKDYLLAYSFFPFAGSGNLDNPYLNIEGDGWITFEVDLNDRAVSFYFAGWSDFASCNFYASKDGGETWYLVADIGEKATGLGGSITEAIQSPELCAANIEKVLTGNPEKKFLLKINPTTYGKALICNLAVNTVYNEGTAEDLPLVDETLEAEKAAGAAVDALILAIGDVEYTDESKAKIDAARAAYDALNDMEKPHVKELWTLEDAEDTYESLAKKAANQAKADEVMALIDAIGEVDYTIECRDAIIAALDAYDALTGAQKQMVENKAALDAAQLLYNELRDAADGAEPGHREDKPVVSDPEVSDPAVSDPEVSDTESSTDDTQNPGTGVAIPVAMIGLAVISAGAVLSLKKRR